MNKKIIRLTESDLHRIIKESVNHVLNEGTGRDALVDLFKKAFANLSDNEREFLYMCLNDETWDAVYAAMNVLKPYNPMNRS